MRVYYRSVRNQLSAEVIYEAVGPVEFCCGRMRGQWGKRIAFGVPGCPQTTSHDVNLALSLPQANGTALELVPVEFCPFCGQPVETCRVK